MDWFQHIPRLMPVRIDWQDACTDEPWQADQDSNDYSLVEIHSLGWVLHHDQTSVTIAQSLDREHQSGDRLTIPVKCIICVTALSYKTTP